MDNELESIDLAKVEFTPDLLEIIPRHIARKYRVLPVAISPETLTVAMSDPWDLDTVDALTHLLRREIHVRAANKDQLETFFGRLYSDGYDDVITSRE